LLFQLWDMLKSKQLRLFCSPEQVCQPQWRSLPTSQLPVCVPPTCACEGRNGKTEPSATSSGAKSIITTDECRVELVVHQVVTAKFQDTNSLLGWLTKHKDLLFVEVVVDDRDSHAQRTSYFVEEAGGLSDGVGLPEDGTLWVSKIALDKLSFEVSSASDFCIRAVREKQNDDAPIPGLTSLICSKRPPLPKSNFSANPGQFQSFSEVSDPYLSKNSEKPARLAFPRQEVVGAVRLNVAQDFVRALINDNGKICVPIRQDDGNQGLIWMTVSIHHLQGKKSPTVEWLRHHRTVGLCGHTGAVSCCAISPNEDLVLTLSMILRESFGTLLEKELSHSVGTRGSRLDALSFPLGRRSSLLQQTKGASSGLQTAIALRLLQAQAFSPCGKTQIELLLSRTAAEALFGQVQSNKCSKATWKTSQLARRSLQVTESY